MKKVIGICGPTGAGKTTLAKYLASKYNTPVISFDDYYKEKPTVTKGLNNWEHPKSYNIPQLIKDIRHSEQEIVIAEGFLLFANSSLCDLLSHKIFLYLPMDEIILRRKTRYNKDKRIVDDEYINKILVPYSTIYMRKQIDMADLVVDCRQDLFIVTSEIVNFLAGRIK